MPARLVAGVCLFTALLWPRGAGAVNNEGTPQTFFRRYRVFGDAVRTGNVLILPGGGTGTVVNQIPLASSSSTITGIPTDATVQGAWLFWSASLLNDEAAWSGPTMPDDTADLRTPDGALHGSIIGNCAAELTTEDGHFYYCSAEVTSIVAGLASPNGTYTVGGVDFDYGHVTMPGSSICDPNDPHCQAKYANWSLLVVYAAPSIGTQRDVILYNGFTHFDEEVLPGGVFSPGVGPPTSIQVPPDGFQIPNPPNVQIAYYAMEGDPQLGDPPQQVECPTCFDSFYFYVNGAQHPLGNAGPPNAVGNIMDSAPSPGALGGLDLDEFDVSSFVSPGTVPAGSASPFSFQPRSGDGLFTMDDINQGGGESFFIGWVLFKINRLAPNFTNVQTVKTVDPTQAGAGETLFYTINLTNSGALPATSVQVRDAVPAGESFIAGSTRVDGVACNAPQCTFAANTLTVNFATIPAAPVAGSSHSITFRTTVNGTVTQGQMLCNSAQLTFAETQGAQTLGPACTTVQAPSLGTPTKREVDLGPGTVPQPGDTLQFTITIPKSSSPAANSIRLRDDLPAFLRLIPASIVAPSGAIVTAQATGGANGTGFLQLDNITIPANVPSVTVTFSAHLFTEAEFNGAGVASNSIDGHQVCNQGTVSAPFLSSPLLTDNPDTQTANDPTCVRVTFAPRLTGVKVGNPNSGFVTPGQRIDYTINLSNTGNRSGTFGVTDTLPAGVGGFVLDQPPAGGTTSFTGGVLTVSNLVLAPGASTQIRFHVAVDANAADGTVIQNAAMVTVTEAPAQNTTLRSGAVTVRNRPDLSTMTKAVTGTFRPAGAVHYTITIPNTGNRDATSVVVRDAIDPSLTMVVADAGGTFDAATRTVTWNLGTIAAGATVTVHLDARVVTPLANGTVVSNQAFATATQIPAPGTPSDDPSTVAVDDPTRFTVVSAPDFGAMTKAVADVTRPGGPVHPGDTLRYTINLRNDGNAVSTNTRVTDVVDANLTNVAIVSGSGTLTGRTITWTLGPMAPGDTAMLVFSAQIVRPLDNGTVIANQAFLTSDQVAAPGTPSDDPTTPAVDDPTRVTVTSAPDLSTSTKTVLDENGGQVRPGDFLTYTINLVNSGDAPARNVTVSDVVPANLTAITPLDGGTLAGNTVSWTVARVDTQVQVRFRAQVVRPLANGTSICNIARIAGTITTPPACVQVTSAPAFDPTAKSVTGDTNGVVAPGQALTYTIRLHDSGDAIATGVVVTDVVDASLDTIAPQDGGSFDAATRTITWTVGQVSPLGDSFVHFTARVSPTAANGAVIANQGVISAANTSGPTPTNRVTVRVSSVPNLRLTKVAQVPVQPPRPGQTITWMLTVVNLGPAAATNIVVSDPVDTAFQGNLAALDGGTAAGNVVSWRVPQLAAGNQTSLRFTSRIAPAAPDGTRIANQGSLTADALAQPLLSDDPATAQPNDPTVITVVANSVLSAQKTVTDVNGGTVQPGDQLEYTIRVGNSGTADSDGARLVDPIPALTTLVAGSVRLNGTSQPDGALAGGLVLGPIAPGATATVTFRVRIDANAAAGSTIANQAVVSANNGATVLSDDPRTPAPNDPTVVVVGGGALLIAQKTFDPQPIGGNGDAVFDVGEQIQYRIRLTNVGQSTLTSVKLDDPLPGANAAYSAGSLALNGAPLTDALDGDAGEVFANIVHVRVGQLGPGETANIAFRVRITAGPQVTNQGTVSSQEAGQSLTDADGNPANGLQPTVTPVGNAGGATVTKTAADVNGGNLLAGETVLYSITAHGQGNLRIDDDIPGNLTFVAGSPTAPPGAQVTFTPPPAGASGRGTIEFRVQGDATVTFRATVDARAQNGTRICNQAVATPDAGDPGRSDSVCVVVGSAVGQGGLGGRVYQDIDKNGSFGPADQPLAFEVQAFSAESPSGTPLARATADAQGLYNLPDLPPGDYVLRAFSETGVQFAAVSGVSIHSGSATTRDIPVDPSGRVYQATTGTLVGGATVSIYYDDSEGGAIVPDDKVGAHQQQQRTNALGMYRFDVEGGHKYKLEVEPPMAYTFPSTANAPKPGFAPAGPVVGNAIPKPGDAYFVKFDIERGQPDVTNNHIPLDASTDFIHIDKRADQPRASVGDIITYTVTVQNGSNRDLPAVTVMDVLPTGLAYVRGSTFLGIAAPGRVTQKTQLGNIPARTPLQFGPFDLPSGGTATLVYQAVVGLDTREGIYENIATLRLGNVPVSGAEARARVRVVNDPIFDQGFLFGRVFCDRDGDGRPGANEEGVFGARVYIDTGWYSVTDETGKYHLKDIPPGVHLIKIDTATLPPGSTLMTDESQIIWFTRGLPAKAHFGVHCSEVEVGPDTVERKKGSKPALASPAPLRISGDLDVWTLMIDGPPMPLADATATAPSTLAAPGAVTWKTEVKGPPVASWSLRVSEWSTKKTIRELSGRGPPPPELTWDGKDLARNSVYLYQLEVTTDDGQQVRSAPGVISIGGGEEVAFEKRVPAATLFSATGRLTAAGKRTLTALARELPADGDIVLEAHTDAKANAIKAMALTTTMARAAKDALVAAGVPAERIRAGGLGSSRPLRPNMSPQARAQNRRLELRVHHSAPPAVAPPAPTFEPEVRLAGEVLPIAHGRFGGAFLLPKEGHALLELRRADGRQLSLVIDRSPRGKRSDGLSSEVEGDLGAQRASVFGRPVLLDLLRVDLTVVDGKPVRFRLQQPLANPSRWTVLVRRSSGEVAWRESGQGAPPAELTWPGGEGAFTAQLIVEDGQGGRGSSPERSLTSGEAKQMVIAGGLFDARGQPTAKLRAFVEKTAPSLSGRNAKVHVQVPPTRGGSLASRLIVVNARSAEVRRLFQAAGVQVEAIGGMVPALVQRETVTVVVEPVAATPPRVRINGEDATIDGGRSFRLRVATPPGAPVVLDASDGTGRRAVYVVQPPVATLPTAKTQTATEDGVAYQTTGTRAANLKLQLPPRGLLLQSPQLAVRGRTDPNNQVTINGRSVHVHDDGTFADLIPLPYGKSTVEIRSTDRDGNTAIVKYPVEVKETSFFLMAIADGAISTAWDGNGKLDPDGARLDGMTDETTVETDSMVLHGRAALYLKARVRGGDLARYLDITAHVDTAKRAEFEDFIAQVIDPARFYPVYGDAALEVQDARARDKVYILVETDDKKSHLLVGNFRSQTKGLELFNYDRALYGGEIDVQKAIVQPASPTHVKAFVSQDDGHLAKDHNVFRSTGGSIYFLRHNQLVPGGEQVQVVVRDKDSGMPLLTQPMARDSDYVIDYVGGRLFFKAPIPSLADASFLSSNPAASMTALTGHPVYIEVDYEYQTDGTETGAVWGAQLEQTIGGVLTVGGGYVSEGREGTDYRLWGLESTLKLGNKSSIKGEFARSQSTDSGNFLSQDGGLTFYGLNGVCATISGCDPNAGNHDAWKAELTIVPGDWSKRIGDDELRMHGYFEMVDRGFYSSGSILEQGRTKYGGEITWKLTANDRIVLREDGSRTETPQYSTVFPQPGLGTPMEGADTTAAAKMETELITLQYAGGRGRWAWKGEFTHQFQQILAPFTDGSARLGPDINRGFVATAVQYRLTPRWTLRAGQEIVAYTTNSAQQPDPQIGSFDDHRFATTTIGADYKLAKDLTASATGALRWNGDAALILGLKTSISPTANVYANERLESVDFGTNWTSIVGAEDKFGDKQTGRTYGEYQLQSGVSGQMNRAILGMTNRWEIIRGVSVNGGYEHQHVFGAALPDGTPIGDQQRDVLSFGYNVLLSDRWKVGGRFELRFDDLGGNLSGTPCFGNAQADPRYSPCPNGQQLAPSLLNGPQSGLYADRSMLPGSQLMLTPGRKLEWFTSHTGEWEWHRDLTFLGRFTLLQVDDQDTNKVEARLVELTSGLAYRPLHLDWFNLIFKYTKLLELRPTGLGQGLHTDRHSDIATIIPIIELPWRLQLVEKLAYKHIDQTDDVMLDPLDPTVTGHLNTATDLILWINRLNAHLTQRVDVGAEYRVLKLWMPLEAEQTRQGVLVEVNYLVQRFVRLGVGWNFSRFGDNELADPTQDAFGFFVRVVGRY